jgi:hypothetical protein
MPHRSIDPGPGRKKTRKSKRKFYFTQRTTTRNKKIAQASEQGGSEARNATSERARERASDNDDEGDGGENPWDLWFSTTVGAG